jgi:hypothetical protein
LDTSGAWSRSSAPSISRGPPATAPRIEGASAGGIASVIRNLRGGRRAHDVGAWLCRLSPTGRSSFTEACRRIALTRTGRGVMVILSDFLLKEGYEDGLRALIGRGYDVAIVQVLSPQEIEPTLGGDLRLLRGVDVGGDRAFQLLGNFPEDAATFLDARAAEGADRCPVRLVEGGFENEGDAGAICDLLERARHLPGEFLALQRAGAEDEKRDRAADGDVGDLEGGKGFHGRVHSDSSRAVW